MRLLLLAMLLLAITGCGQKPPDAPPSPTTTGTEAEARALLEAFLDPDADHAALTANLRPKDEDYAAVFDADHADRARTMYDDAWKGGKILIRPKEGQTSLSMDSATTEDFRAANRHAGKFDRRWREAAPHLKEGLTWHGFRFTRPGRPRGLRFEGLAFVNGHWAFFPRPWNVTRSE